MFEKLLSIIIPVYNAAPYLIECVESIIQDLPSPLTEIILIDDGSTDSSGLICDTLCNRYECVRCIHKNNAGVSAARNDGIYVAAGQYIAFVDADDRISPGGIFHVIEWISYNTADICFLQASKFFPDGVSVDLGDRVTHSGVYGHTKEAVFNYLASRPKFPGSACTKLFRRAFLLENGLRFPEGRTNGEDLVFVMHCILAANLFDALDTPYYEYRQNRIGSATQASFNRSYPQLCLYVSEFAKHLTNNQKPTDCIATSAMSFVAYEYAILLWRYCHLSASSKHQALTFLRQYKWVIKFAKSRKLIAIQIFMKCFGIRITAFLMRFYMELFSR